MHPNLKGKWVCTKCRHTVNEYDDVSTVEIILSRKCEKCGNSQMIYTPHRSINYPNPWKKY